MKVAFAVQSRGLDEMNEYTRDYVVQELKRLTGCEISPELISETGNEICVVCGADTGVYALTPTDERQGYVPGNGQLCKSCYKK
jgi:hypothetical protein